MITLKSNRSFPSRGIQAKAYNATWQTDEFAEEIFFKDQCVCDTLHRALSITAALQNKYIPTVNNKTDLSLHFSAPSVYSSGVVACKGEIINTLHE